ncbi:putative cuticle collagen 80 isoform X1 [Ursus maritimus]|uniref:Cuticle collagen 80 isoform X1 n=1 Tax=Ursus maritimus TaxID=29073 RepID=A0A8M1G6X6_URSMA|nr:putative cuticle collagen 80 isoform X1 [Ursus maritimus]
MQGTRRRPAEGPGGPGVAADPGRVEKAREGAEVQAPGARPRPLGPGPAPLDPARHGRPLPPGGAGLLQPMSAGGPARPMNAPALGRPASRGEPASESAGGAGGGRRGTPAKRPRLRSPGRARKFLFPEPGSAGTLRGTALVSAFCKASSPAAALTKYHGLRAGNNRHLFLEAGNPRSRDRQRWFSCHFRPLGWQVAAPGCPHLVFPLYPAPLLPLGTHISSNRKDTVRPPSRPGFASVASGKVLPVRAVTG